MNGLDFNTVEMSRVTLNSRDFDRSLSYVLQLKEFYKDSSGAMGELWGSGPSKKLAEFIQSYFYKHKYNYVMQVGNESVNDPHLQEVIVGLTQLGLMQVTGLSEDTKTAVVKQMMKSDICDLEAKSHIGKYMWWDLTLSYLQFKWV